MLQLASSTLVFLILVRFMDKETFGELGALLALVFPVSVGTLGSHFLLLRRSSQGHDLADAWSRANTVGLAGSGGGGGGDDRPSAAAVAERRPPGLRTDLRRQFAVLLDQRAGGVPRSGHRSAEAGRPGPADPGRLPFRRAGVVRRVGRWQPCGMGRRQHRQLHRWGDRSPVFVRRAFGLTPRFEPASFSDLPPGIPFSVNSVNESLVDSSDRWLLTRFDHKADAVLYTLGARLVQFGYLPLRTLLRAYDADLFGAGKDGVRAALVVTRRMIKPGMAIAAAVGLSFLLLAPLLPLVAGSDYDESVDVIRLLSVLPAIRMVQYLAGNILSAADRQPWRMTVTGLAMVTNLGLNLWLLREGTWRTAIFTTFVSELLLAGLLIGIVAYWVRRGRGRDSEPEPAATGQP